jgi:hypothetical protein
MSEMRNPWMTPETATPVTRGHFVTLILGTAAVVIAANLATAWYLNEFPVNRGYWLISAKWELLDQQETPVDWLILGDSSGNSGMDPKVVQEELGGTSLNLCLVGDMLVLGDAWMLDRYVSRVGAPKHVIIVHAPTVWARSFGQSSCQLLASSPLKLQSLRSLRPPLELTLDQTVEVIKAKAFPISSNARSLMTMLRSPGQWFDRRELRLSDDGFMPIDPARADAAGVRIEAGRLRASASQLPRGFSSESRAALEQIAWLAEKHGIEVYIVCPPVLRGLDSDPDFKQYLDSIADSLKTFAHGRPRIHVLMDAPPLYGAEEMQTLNHVIGTTAPDYTRHACAAIGHHGAKD